ncbi:MAG: HTTM domain-containing protein [Saprospiraceae bacterium]
MVAFFTYSGLIFDLVIGFMLLYKPTRWIALGCVVFFNITNSWIFDDIGVFPFTMLAATVLFFDTKGLFEKTGKRGRKEKSSKPESFTTPSWLKTGLTIYVCFQLLFPFRHWLLPNDVDWTSVAQRFSWRMKIQFRDIKKMEWKVKNSDTGEEFPVDLAVFTHDMQRRYMGDDARYAYRFAQYLVEFSKENGIANPEVYADIEVSFNGRPVQKFIRPDVDLSKVNYSPFKKIEWIMPLKED